MPCAERPGRALFAAIALSFALPWALTPVLSAPAWASADLDRQYALETVGALRSYDNVDGLFGDYVAQAYKDWFAHQSRFVYQDLEKTDPILTSSKIPYYKVINDNEILAKLARQMKSQTLLRTRIEKEGPEYRITIDWLIAPKMDVLSTEAFTLGEEGGMQNIKPELEAALTRLFSKIPFIGKVTGRDNDSVTTNIGASAGLKAGDQLVTGTLDEVKRHPLLHQIVDWRFSQTGKLEVESVDESLAFCKVIEEEPGRRIARYQKILQVMPKPFKAKQESESSPEEAETEPKDELPRLGFVSIGPWMGGFSRDYSVAATGGGRSGSAFTVGGRADGELWWDRNWFTDLSLGYLGYNFSQTNKLTQAQSPAQGSGGNVFNFLIDMGYNFFATSEFFGPKGWLKFGYESFAYSLPAGNPAAGDVLTPISFKSFFVGLGGDLPVRGGYGATMNLNFGLFNSATENGTPTASISSSKNVEFYVGAYFRYETRTTFRLGIDIVGDSADYTGGNTLSQKLITVAPQVSFYF